MPLGRALLEGCRWGHPRCFPPVPVLLPPSPRGRGSCTPIPRGSKGGNSSRLAPRAPGGWGQNADPGLAPAGSWTHRAPPHPSLGSQLDPGSSLRAVYSMHSSALREGFTREPHSKTRSECRGAARPWQRVPSPLLHPVLGPRRQSLAAGLPPDIPPLPQPPRCPSCRTAGRPSARTAGWTSASWRWAARTRAGSRSSGKAEA